jgi:hypothetical protein
MSNLGTISSLPNQVLRPHLMLAVAGRRLIHGVMTLSQWKCAGISIANTE